MSVSSTSSLSCCRNHAISMTSAAALIVPAGTTAFVAGSLTALNPIVGAVFAVTTSVASLCTLNLNCRVVTLINKKLELSKEVQTLTGLSQIIIPAIGLGFLATILIGAPLTFSASVVLAGTWTLSTAVTILGALLIYARGIEDRYVK